MPVLLSATKRLWQRLKPELDRIGQFWRLEAIVPDGLPDVMGVVQGRAVFIELKGLGDRLRAQQRLVLMQLADAGAECWVVTERRDGIELVEIVAGDIRPGQP